MSCYNDDIGVICFNGNGLATLRCCIPGMYKHSGVSLLMGAWGHGIQGPHFVESVRIGEFQPAVTFEMYGACRCQSVKQELLGSHV